MNSLNEKLKELNKQYGEGTINEISKFNNIEIERIPTGSFALDEVLGQGLPKGRLLEIYGQESSGKSVLSLFIAAEVQRRGGKVAYLDPENGFAVQFAKDIGVDVDKLIFSQEVVMEDVLNMVAELIKTNSLDLIIVDSVASLVPSKELEGNVGELQMALQARIMSQALRIITGAASKTKTSLIFINQIREKVGIFFGSPNVTPGGKALKFYSSIRLEVRKGKLIEGENKEIIGNTIKIIATKNKTAMPFKEAEFNLYYRTGIDKQAELLDYATKYNLIEHKGNTFYYANEKIGVGRDHAIAELKTNVKLYDTIAEQLKKIYYESPDSIPQQIIKQDVEEVVSEPNEEEKGKE